jgi:hypothetical protein
MMMALTTDDQNQIEAFREYVTDTVATDDRYGPGVRSDNAQRQAIRFHEGGLCWFEVALFPAARNVRVGFFTTDPAVSTECEEVIAESGETAGGFVGLAFEEAGLDWPDPPVDHGRDGEASYYATPLPFEDMIDLDSDELRDKVIRMLEGYLIAFGPALGAEEPD